MKAKVPDREIRDKVFDGKKKKRLGTTKDPAVVTVQTKERADELKAVFETNGWKYRIDIVPDAAEETSALDTLLNPAKPYVAGAKVKPNQPCSCGSGKKHKKCCGR